MPHIIFTDLHTKITALPVFHHPVSDCRKITSEIKKTMSDAGKTTSDAGKIISDLFSAFANPLKASPLQRGDFIASGMNFPSRLLQNCASSRHFVQKTDDFQPKILSYKSIALILQPDITILFIKLVRSCLISNQK